MANAKSQQELQQKRNEAGVQFETNSYNRRVTQGDVAMSERVLSRTNENTNEKTLKYYDTVRTQATSEIKNAETNLEYLKNMDRRASLTVAPKMGLESQSLFSDKVLYALGTKEVPSPKAGGRTFYNFLQTMLGTTGGIIFPYTPSIDTSYRVNYDTTDIPQSNAQYNSYKSSPPPSINVTAKFTCDSKLNAAYMLSAIWFLEAITKCDVGNGVTYYTQATKSGGGLPPPLLYFNAYHQLMENIPVLISTFSLRYPDDIDYVNLVIDMEKKDDAYYNAIFDDTAKRVNKETLEVTPMNNSSFLNDNYKMSFWLPLELSISMSFLIQPNLARENNVFNLDAYKAGVLKNSRVSNVLTSSGTISDPNLFKGKGTSPTTAWTSNDKKYLPTGWSW